MGDSDDVLPPGVFAVEEGGCEPTPSLAERVRKRLEELRIGGYAEMETLRRHGTKALRDALSDPESMFVKCDDQICVPDMREQGISVIEFGSSNSAGMEIFRIEIDANGKATITWETNGETSSEYDTWGPTTITNCTRCGESHDLIIFEKLAKPMPVGPEPDRTHWAMCPTTEQPIIMRVEGAS